MSFVPVPSQSDIQTALRLFLINILPTGTQVIRGQDNRVPEPSANDFVVMTAIRRDRIETNTDTRNDCAFNGSIAGTTLTITSIQYGVVTIGNTLFGAGVASGTKITAFGTGTGGIGTYTINISQNVSGLVIFDAVAVSSMSTLLMASGTQLDLQPTRITIQLDVHGPNSADSAQTISTLFRDEYGTAFFSESGYDVQPLYADDPKQIPFINAEQAYETRYVIDAVLQANQVVAPPQQYLQQIEITIEPPAELIH